jgi:hypothetical protein
MVTKNTVTQADIDKMIRESQVQVKTMFGKCTIVAVQLKNGFVIVESSSCVDPMNYSEAQGMAICMERIKNKLWELEGYKLQNELGGN